MKKIILLSFITLCTVMLSLCVLGALTDGLVQYYKLDESGRNFTDSVSGLNISDTGSITHPAGIIGNGVGMKGYGSTDGLTGNMNAGQVDLGDNATFSFWFKYAGRNFNGANAVANRMISAGQDNYFIGAGRGTIWGGGAEFVANYAYTGQEQNYQLSANEATYIGWHHYVVVRAGSNVSLFVDGSYAVSKTTMTTQWNANPNTFDVGFRVSGGNPTEYANGTIDEIGVWNRSLAFNEITQLYNNGTGNQYPFAPSSNMTTPLLLNLNNVPYSNLSITEQQAFYKGANFTYGNGSVITNGNCSFTSQNISGVFRLTGANTSLTSASPSLTLMINEGNSSLINDTRQYSFCRSGGTPSLRVIIQNQSVRNFTSAEITLCSAGYNTMINSTLNYIGSTNINFTLYCPDCTGSNSIRIVSVNNVLMKWDRQFTTHSENLAYNSTLGFYVYNNHPYEYFNAGNRTINVTCSGVSNTSTVQVTDQNLTIQILSIDESPYVDGMTVESTNSTDIVTSVSNDVPTFYNLSVTYPNGTLIKQTSSYAISLNNTELNINGLYNISIKAIDDDTNITYTKTGFFYINDSILPDINYYNPVQGQNVTQGVAFDTLITCTDLNLYSYDFNVMYPNSSSYIHVNGTTTGTNFSITQTITPDKLGIWKIVTTCYDSHTKKVIPDFQVANNAGNMTFLIPYKKTKKAVSITTNDKDYDSSTFTKAGDRYNFNYSFSSNKNQLQFNLCCEGLVILPDSNYPGHVLCWATKTWIDFNESDVNYYTLSEPGNSSCTTVDLYFSKSKKVFQFQSIGQMNINQANITFNVVADASQGTVLTFGVCPQTLPGQVMLWFTLAMLMIIYAFCLKIDFLGICKTFTSFGVIVWSAYYFSCAKELSLLIGGIGIMMMAYAVVIGGVIQFFKLIIKLISR